MPVEFRFPDVGEGIREGELKSWKVKVGQQINEHDVLAEVETDKAVVEIPSPVSGKVLTLNFKEGDTIKVGQVMVTLSGEAKEAPAPQAVPSKKPEPERAVAVVGILPEAEEHGILATPAVRKLAQVLKVDLSKVKGTGPGGRIIENDIRAAAQQKPAEAPKVKLKHDFWGYLDRVPLRGVRKVIAQRLSESWSKAVHTTAMADADLTELVRVREVEKEKAAKKGVKLTYLPYIIKAVIAALKESPYLNASLDEVEGEIILKKYYNIGVAVATDDGLMVPVIKAVDQKDIYTIAQEIEKLAKAARERTLDLADLKGGTFTITNYGSLGGTYGTPIINYPEAAILGVGRIVERPTVIDGKIIPRNILPLSLTFDHRIIDGGHATVFLNKLIELLANPKKLV